MINILASPTMFLVFAIALGITVALSYGYNRILVINRPPGPLGLPAFGNIFQMPTEAQWIKFEAWARAFGDVLYLNIFGQPVLLVQSGKAANDLFDKRSAIYSDRPKLLMAGELCGMEKIAPLTRFGQPLRDQRRLMQRVLSQRAVLQYQCIQEREIRCLLQRLLENPENFSSHIRRCAGATILEIIYGYRVQSDDDYFIHLAEEAMRISARVGTSAWAVDFFPILKHLPSWTPGVKFHKVAKECKKAIEDSVNLPFEFSRDMMRRGVHSPCLVSSMLQTEDGLPVGSAEEDLVKWTANSLYAAGADTTAAVISSFVLAMLLKPGIQAKAQREIDSIVGTERLPTLADKESLPYVNCVVHESLRWSVAVPLATPRELMENDIYRGWKFSKGTLLISNIWSMLRDQTIYPHPEDFMPERYLVDSDKEIQKLRDPCVYAFGFGRRRCPGVHLAESSIWLVITSILATLTIVRDKDEMTEPKVEFTESGIRHPKPFKCRFVARHDSKYPVQ